MIQSTHQIPVKILLIEDELPLRRFLRATLHSEGFDLVEAITANDGISMAVRERPDVIILDLGLPDLDGLEVTRRIREWSHTPIIVLSARGNESDKIVALDSGADDYLTKPFGTGELLARIRVALRHTTQRDVQEEPSVEIGSIVVDLDKRQVFLRGEEIHLTPNEYKLLTALIKHAGKVVTHRQLLKEVWGEQFIRESHYLRVYMAQLRHKLEEDPARPRFLCTEPGVGYRLKLERISNG